MADTPPPLVIYHKNCVDGFAAAWVANEYFKTQGIDAEFLAASYGDKPPVHLPLRNVFIVDFSYPAEALEQMGDVNNVVIVLDHHKTAAEALAKFAPPPSIGHYELIHAGTHSAGQDRFPEPIYAEFDMHRSGAGITWDYFFPAMPRPSLVDFVEDRDLWKFSLTDTRALHAALASYPMLFDVWTDLAAKMESPYRRAFLVGEGTAIDRRHLQMCNETIISGARRMVIGGHAVPVCNAPFPFASDIGHLMCKGQPFAATYFDLANGRRQFSLRSTNAGLDVSVIAKSYGGGGHRNAAGFTADGNWQGDEQ